MVRISNNFIIVIILVKKSGFQPILLQCNLPFKPKYWFQDGRRRKKDLALITSIFLLESINGLITFRTMKIWIRGKIVIQLLVGHICKVLSVTKKIEFSIRNTFQILNSISVRQMSINKYHHYINLNNILKKMVFSLLKLGPISQLEMPKRARRSLSRNASSVTI